MTTEKQKKISESVESEVRGSEFLGEENVLKTNLKSKFRISRLNHSWIRFNHSIQLFSKNVILFTHKLIS